MLTLQFIAQNIHFAISLFAALVFFAVFWLYFDAWLGEERKTRQDTLKWLGFLAVSVSFVIYATLIEEANLGQSVFGDTASLAASTLRLVGYIVIILGQVLDPLQERPKTHGLAEEYAENKSAPASAALGAGLTSSNGYGSAFALPAAALGIALLYWRRATVGIERHLKPVAYAFALLTAFELLDLTSLLRSTTNPNLYNLVAAFGPLWILAQLCLLGGAIILGRWVWRYLTERFMSQIFMTFTGIVLAVFLLTTISFTFLVLRNIQDDGLNNLATATSVLQYALESKKASTQANAEAVAANPAITQAIVAKDHKSLATLTVSFLASKQQASLVITTADGQVLLRAEDPNRWGDSISSDTLLRRALIGEASSTVETQSGVLAPTISIRSVVPVRDVSGSIVGTVSVATVIDNAFVDGIKHATGLDSAVYGGNVRSATTFTAPDGTSRWIGVKETDGAVLSTVLQHGDVYKGQLDVLNRAYLAVYAPMKDTDNTIVGMLFIGEPEVSILATTAYLIRLTFIVSVALLVASIIPAYLVARYITHQLE